MTLTKAELVDRVYERCGFSKKEATELVELVFAEIKRTLASGESIKLSGFGNFNVRQKKARIGRNPQTGDAIEITARKVLTFSVSQVLKDALNGRGPVVSPFAHNPNRVDTDE